MWREQDYNSAVSWQRDLWKRLRRDLPGMIALWIAVIPGLVIFGEVTGHPIARLREFVAGLVVLAVAATPLVWMRWETPIVPGPRGGRRSVAALGAGCAWFVGVLLAGAVVLHVLGVD